jgi:hypothetical protein
MALLYSNLLLQGMMGINLIRLSYVFNFYEAEKDDSSLRSV